MTIKKLYCFSSLILIASPVLADGGYVPPPTGPYQSTVVINNLFQPDSSSQVYRFPPSDLIQTRRPAASNVLTGKPDDNPPKEINPSAEATQNSAPAFREAQSPAFSQPSKSAGRNFSNNPWAPARPNTYQQNWGNPSYPVPQQYPYGYPNQNNFMNGPFNGMPSPWTAMPMQPFFSGR